MLAVSLPSAGLAIDSIVAGNRPAAKTGLPSFTPASADPKVAALVARSGGGERLMRFTPAGAAEPSARPVTVAVRVDENASGLVSVRAVNEAVQARAGGNAPTLRITPTRYSLGLARGYDSFTKTAAAPALSRSLSNAQIPDLATFRPAPGAAETPSRFAARIEPDEDARNEAAPRTSDLAERALDLEGSYRLTRNLDVTAGVRYSRDRDRLAPIADTAKQDSQAVYVGTQFRF